MSACIDCGFVSRHAITRCCYCQEYHRRLKPMTNADMVEVAIPKPPSTQLRVRMQLADRKRWRNDKTIDPAWFIGWNES